MVSRQVNTTPRQQEITDMQRWGSRVTSFPSNQAVAFFFLTAGFILDVRKYTRGYMLSTDVEMESNERCRVGVVGGGGVRPRGHAPSGLCWLTILQRMIARETRPCLVGVQGGT